MSKMQKVILKTFDVDDVCIKERALRLSEQPRNADEVKVYE